MVQHIWPRGPQLMFLCLECWQITDMQVKIANIRKEKARKNDTQMSKKGQTQRAIRTLEYKLDRVSDNLCNKILVSAMRMHCMNSISLFSMT